MCCIDYFIFAPVLEFFVNIIPAAALGTLTYIYVCMCLFATEILTSYLPIHNSQKKGELSVDE
jgi:hypothetical protein